LIPPFGQGNVTQPNITAPALWMGWNIKHTVGLAIDDINGAGGRFDSEMKELLQDTDRLDKRITQIQTGWLEFSLLDLSAIVASRSPDKNRTPFSSFDIF
jgi:hypothetical protein